MDITHFLKVSIKPFSENDHFESREISCHNKITMWKIWDNPPIFRRKIGGLSRFSKKFTENGLMLTFKEGVDTFYNKLNNVLEKIICEDIPSIFNIRYSTISSIKKLFYLVATSQPFTPNISRISSQLDISKEYVYSYIEELQNAGLFVSFYPKTKGFKLVRKPQKIYLENTNLFYLAESEKCFSIEKGSIRETFFINQVSSSTKVFSFELADFIDEKDRIFEIGGKGKKEKEISGESFIVLDDINIGFGDKIPLWLFGFLY